MRFVVVDAFFWIFWRGALLLFVALALAVLGFLGVAVWSSAARRLHIPAIASPFSPDLALWSGGGMAGSWIRAVIGTLLVCSAFGVRATDAFDGFIDNQNGTLTDPRNGLIWKRCAEGSTFDGSACAWTAAKMNWFDAMHVAKTSRFLDKDDWRLPSRGEYESVLAPRSAYNQATGMLEYFPGRITVSRTLVHPVSNGRWGMRNQEPAFGTAWSFSPSRDHGTSNAALAFFNQGSIGGTGRYDANHIVRLVRSPDSANAAAKLEFEREYEKMDSTKARMAMERAGDNVLGALGSLMMLIVGHH